MRWRWAEHLCPAPCFFRKSGPKKIGKGGCEVAGGLDKTLVETNRPPPGAEQPRRWCWCPSSPPRRQQRELEDRGTAAPGRLRAAGAVLGVPALGTAPPAPAGLPHGGFVQEKGENLEGFIFPWGMAQTLSAGSAGEQGC